MAYQSVVKCIGLVNADLDEISRDITKEFSHHRTWHQDVKCWHKGGTLFITALNEFDCDGLALLDEFADCVVAYHGEHGPITVVSVSNTLL